jgi:hypothetical protein
VRRKKGTGFFFVGGGGLSPFFAALLLSACNCDPLAQNGTAVRVRVDLDPAVRVTQLRFAVTVDGGDLFAPIVRPDTPGSPLQSGGTLLVLVDDGLAGTSVACPVDGLDNNMTVGAGIGMATVSKGIEVPCLVTVLPPQMSGCSPMNCAGCCSASDVCIVDGGEAACGAGGSLCSACQSGQHCSGAACVCDSTSCSAGCCGANEVCVLDGGDGACGVGGSLCAACQGGQYCSGGACICDGTSCAGCCSANGGCIVDGGNAACGLGGDVCAACQGGQHCNSGACVCDVTSCNGCCAGTSCLDGGADSACGRGGQACDMCRTAMGETCSGNMCICDGGACTAGCNFTTCPSGCCDSMGMCVASDTATCGTGGVQCRDCSSLTTDTCTNGGCTCGALGACPSGQHCVGMTCVCDEVSCSNGCCQGTTCVTTLTKQRCGIDGGICRGCTGMMMCNNGVCG